MSNNQMTPQWVVENFLPDYQERYRDYYEVDIDDDLSPDYELEYPDWIDKHFPEALLGLLKAQREECYEAWHSAIAEKGEPYYESIATAIRNSPIPEPKNRR